MVPGPVCYSVAGVASTLNTRSESRISALPTLESGKVEVVGGQNGGRNVLLKRGQSIVVGRSERCDLQLSDRRVSSEHAEISLAKRGFLVRDLGSHNGTHYGPTSVGEIALGPGSEIRVGDTYILLHAPTAHTPPSTSDRSSMGGLVGDSHAMRRAYSRLEAAARSDAPVLITGETGTGKELAARAIHESSNRASGPFAIWDCGHAVPSLMASELFGHIKGAFTGASEDKLGIADTAAGGTLFIDEIGELPELLQPLLLRLAETFEVQPIGSSRSHKVDFRIIAATCRDLDADVAAGRFRRDLYYRLGVLSVVMPPLRERSEDMPQLIREILGEEESKRVVDLAQIDGKNLQLLMQHSWPGNVRELRNTLLASLARGGESFSDLTMELVPSPDSVDPHGSFGEQKKQLIRSFEEKFLRDLLSKAGGSIRAACRASGLERTQLRRLLDKYGLRGT